MGSTSKLSSSQYESDDISYRPTAEINITPMVDVMLVLLIIFMVAAPLMVTGVSVELPKTAAAKLGQTKKPLVVTLTPDGQIQVRNDLVAREKLISKLNEIKSLEGDSVVYIRADRKSPYGDIMELLGEVGKSGFARISLLSQPIPKSTSQDTPLTKP